MKKILTIAATGVICVLAGATQTLAQSTVANPGTAVQVCSITGTTNGALAQNADGDLTTDIAGGAKGTVAVKCSSSSAKLNLGTPSLDKPVGSKPATADSNFNGGTAGGPFATASGKTVSSIVTKKAGSTANVSSTVTADNGEILTPGSYTVTVPASITP
jgi:hypothetical protein